MTLNSQQDRIGTDCSVCGRAWADGQVFLGVPDQPPDPIARIVWRRWWVCSLECAHQVGAGKGGPGELVDVEGPRMSVGGLRMTVSPALAEMVPR